MKKIARLLALAMAVLMIFSLAACSGGGSTTNNDSETPNTDPNAPSEWVFDMGGKAIKVACWWKPMPTENASTEKARYQYIQMQEAMKKYNFTVEEIVVDQREIKPSFEAAQMAGDVWADVTYMRAEQAEKLAKAGSLLPLQDLYPMDSVEYNQNIRDRFTINGNTYAFTYYMDNFENCIAFNKDVFDQAGVEYPYTLVDQGKWTWDKFIETIQKTTIKDATTGKTQVYGYYASTGLGQAEKFMYTCIGRELSEIDPATGKYVSNAKDPEVLAFMDRVRSLNTMKDYVYLPPSNVTEWQDAPEKFKSGRIAMYNWSMSGGPNALKEMEADWGVVPIPVEKEGQAYKLMNTTQNVHVMPAALSKDMDWAKKVAYVYHLIHKDPYTDEERDAKFREEIESQLRDEKSVDIVLKFTNNPEIPVTLHNSTMIGNDSHWSTIDIPAIKALSGEDTVARAFASFADAHAALVADANGEAK